jgi:hypothetical protein
MTLVVRLSLQSICFCLSCCLKPGQIKAFFCRSDLVAYVFNVLVDLSASAAYCLHSLVASMAAISEKEGDRTCAEAVRFLRDLNRARHKSDISSPGHDCTRPD